MASTLRTARSNAAPVAPAGRGSDGAARPAARPQLHVIDGSSQRNGSRSTGSLARIIAWTQARGASLIHVTVAIVFLVATLLITLMLRTQMVQNSSNPTRCKTTSTCSPRTCRTIRRNLTS